MTRRERGRGQTEGRCDDWVTGSRPEWNRTEPTTPRSPSCWQVNRCSLGMAAVVRSGTEGRSQVQTEHSDRAALTLVPGEGGTVTGWKRRKEGSRIGTHAVQMKRWDSDARGIYLILSWLHRPHGARWSPEQIGSKPRNYTGTNNRCQSLLGSEVHHQLIEHRSPQPPGRTEMRNNLFCFHVSDDQALKAFFENPVSLSSVFLLTHLTSQTYEAYNKRK